MKAHTKPSIDKKIDDILRTVTKLAVEFYQFKSEVEPRLAKVDKIDKIENDVAWLVNEYSTLDEDKTVANYQIQENSDSIKRLEARSGRIEENLKLPKIKFSF